MFGGDFDYNAGLFLIHEGNAKEELCHDDVVSRTMES